jgi:hypothetical protein
MAGHRRVQSFVALAVLFFGLILPLLVMANSVKTNGTMPSFGDVENLKISPDGQCVVYRADQETDNAIDLYSAPVNLDATLPDGTVHE